MAITLETINRQLAAIERDPLPSNVQQNQQMRIHDGEGYVTRTAANWVATAQGIHQRARRGWISRPNEKDLLRLERQTMALMYRANVDKRAYTQQEKAALEQTFSDILVRYKRNQELYPGGDGNLTNQDRAQIHEACQNFPHFVQALCDRNRAERSDDVWTQGFVKFCLRSCGLSSLDARHWVKIFIELPNEVDAFMGSFDKRVGSIDPQMLQIIERDGRQVLCMRMNGQDVRIQGSKNGMISLPNLVDRNAAPYTLSVQEIYNKIRGKRAGYLEVEVFQNGGVLNWDSIEMGSTSDDGELLTRIDVSQPGWINNLPAWRVLTGAQVRERYGNRVNWAENLPHDQRFGLAMCANREEASLNMVNTHGFFEVIVPEPGQPDRFRILPFGFQPPTLPGTAMQKAEILLKTQRALLHYPDEGAVRSDRGQYREFFSISTQQFGDLETFLSRFVTKAREGREIFQLTGNNCARHTQKVFDKVVGKMFYQPFEALAGELFHGRDVHSEIKRITKSLDERALDRLANEVGARVVEGGNRQQMARLLSLCLNTLSETMAEGAPVGELRLSEEQALERIAAFYEANASREAGVDRVLKGDLSRLIKLTIGSQQFYKLPFFDAEFRDNLALWGFYSFIRSVALNWWMELPSAIEWVTELPRILCFYIFTCILLLPIGAWRGYEYRRNDGTMQTARVLTNPLNGRMMHLPAQAFNRPALKQQWQEEVRTVLGHLGANVQASPLNPEPHAEAAQLLIPGLIEVRA